MSTQTLDHQLDRRLTGTLAVVVLLLALSSIACEPTPAPELAQLPSPPFGAVNPQTWIEFPLEGRILPMGPVPLVAYGSDPRSVVQIDLRVNGQVLPAGQLRGMDATGGYRLVRLDYTWQPSAEGQYILEARAHNSAGTYGLPAYVKFCVGSCQFATSTPTPAPRSPTWTPTPAPYPTWTPTPAPYPTWTPTPAPRLGVSPTFTPTPMRTPITVVAPPSPSPKPAASINFRSDAPYVNGGSCTTLRWDVDNVQAVALDGQGVVGHGSKQVCPCQQTTYTLSVLKFDNTTENRTVTIMVYGSCAPPASPTTLRPPTATAPPQDRTGPSISGVGVRREGCQFFGYATINDPSGVARATFQISRNGGAFGGVWMKNLGGGNWETEVGIAIGTSSVKIDYYVEATDTANNQSKSGTRTENFSGCGY